jgi:archaellum component FlaG (FlaF/FlaG flagellin family)
LRPQNNNMKTVLFTIATGVLLTLAACNNSSASNATANSKDAAAHLKDSANYTTALWSDSLQNFGTVDKGKQVKIVFHVKNTGSHPLFITSASPSCGCTVADYTRSAIASGASGEVSANFDSNHGSVGKIHKSIAVVTNTNPSRTTLVFEGEVAAKQ